jgi:hypothetical protein
LQFIRQEFPKAVVETLLDVRKEVESVLLETQELYVKCIFDTISQDIVSLVNRYPSIESICTHESEKGILLFRETSLPPSLLPSPYRKFH